MFVGDNFLTLFDRLSTKSTVTGKTGTLLGIFGSVAFIVISFVLFIGPVIFYFKGDYIQGIFPIIKQQRLQLYSGCDFKMAISFYQKKTGKLINHNSISNFIQPKVGFYSASEEFFQTDVEQCYDEYFTQMENKTKHFNKQDCFIVPNGIKFLSQTVSGSTSVFGFKFQSVCKDPFLCIEIGNAQNGPTQQRIQFFSNHFYVLRFTTQYIDDYGNFKKKFVQLYSEEFSGAGIAISQMYALFNTQKIYLDNSIMPWFNNQTKQYIGWQGLTTARLKKESDLVTDGVGTFLAVNTIQNVLFREYKKLDWLLGMLGGGIFLLFLIFWVPCNFISTLKQKIQNCQSIVLLKNQNEIFKPNFSKLWYLSNLIPFKLKCCRSDNKIIYEAQKFLDIACMVKKLKVAARNLKARKFTAQFAPRNLQYNLEPINENYTEEQLRQQISASNLEKIKTYQRIPQIYKNNISMLMLYDNEGNNEIVQNHINEITSYEKYSKISVPKFADRSKLSYLGALGKKLAYFFSHFFKLFDVFGAKPNLVGNQQNFSGFGCFLTLFICVISIFTFALTLGNMSVTKTYWDQIYVAPQNQTVKSVTGKQFRAAICISRGAFFFNLVTGQDRVVDFKFYQYKRQGTVENYYYYDLIRGSQQQYFDVPSQAYNGLSLKYCFLPEDNMQIEVHGDATSYNESYVGFKIIPHCFGTPAYCSANKNTTYQKFYDLLSYYIVSVYYPQAKYYPDLKKVMITQGYTYLSQQALYYDLKLFSPIEQQMYLDTLQMIDDYSSWILGDYPAPKTQILTRDIQQVKSHLNSIQNYVGEPYYKLKIAVSGKVKRIMFSSYKIDFLFATIGGCFVFYFFFFGCFGKAFNNYKMKVKLADVLYNEDSQGISGFKSFLHWIRILCCKDQVMKKIQNDIDCVRLAKNVDSVYRLSAAGLENPIEQNLSLIYLKERIKADEQVVIKAEQSSSDEQNDDFELDWQVQMRRQRQRLRSTGINAIENVSDIDEVHDQQANQKEQLQASSNMINQPMNEPNPTVKEAEKCGTFINNFDIFPNNPQFTLDGKRSIQSVFGGIFCICMLIFICFLTSHFLTIYFSQFHRVSQNQIVDQDQQDRKMVFEVGKNFKFALSFYKINNYDFLDVSNITNDVGISVIKYKTEKINGVFDEYELQKIDLQNCRPDYLEGFLDPHEDPKYFKDLNKAYCVPDGTVLSLYGSTQDPVRQYFSIKIYNKYGYNNTVGLEKVKFLLQNYLPRYHISNPILDYRVSGNLRYSTNEVLKSFTYQISTSREYNLTLTKNIIQYDTAVNPTNQRPSFSSYEIKNYQSHEFAYSFPQNIDRYNELSFYPEEFYNLYVIKSIKVNQIFGIVGGCIAFLFMGLGCIPRSYNAYKMRYMIGTKLYTILGKKKQVVIKNVKGKKTSTSKKDEIEQLAQLSQLQLMRAWVLSVWGFIKNNYNTVQLMRHSSLIQSKVGKDINIFQFMKMLNSCENGIRKMNLAGDTDLNLCRIYPKQLITRESVDQSNSKQLIQDIRQHYPELMDAAKVNEFSQWELKVILDAKENNITIQNIFQQKWLDRFFGINRSSVASRSNYSHSQIRSQINNSENPTRSLMEESNKDKRNEQNLKDLNYMPLKEGSQQRILSDSRVDMPERTDEFEQLPDS